MRTNSAFLYRGGRHLGWEYSYWVNSHSPYRENWAWIRCSLFAMRHSAQAVLIQRIQNGSALAPIRTSQSIATNSVLLSLISIWRHIYCPKKLWSWKWSELSKFNFLKTTVQARASLQPENRSNNIHQKAFSDSAIYCVIDDISLMIID